MIREEWIGRIHFGVCSLERIEVLSFRRIIQMIRFVEILFFGLSWNQSETWHRCWKHIHHSIRRFSFHWRRSAPSSSQWYSVVEFHFLRTRIRILILLWRWLSFIIGRPLFWVIHCGCEFIENSFLWSRRTLVLLYRFIPCLVCGLFLLTTDRSHWTTVSIITAASATLNTWTTIILLRVSRLWRCLCLARWWRIKAWFISYSSRGKYGSIGVLFLWSSNCRRSKWNVR